jgi:mono/diheme cytochrome c family protein
VTVRTSLLAFCGTLVLGFVLTGCRQDMHNQPKFIPLRSSEFFPDGRSARYPVTGTIAQMCPNFVPPDTEAAKDKEDFSKFALCVDKKVDDEQLDPQSYFLTGRHNGATLGNDLPATLGSDLATDQKMMRAFLKRGQQRYDIYCTPCHSLIGDGQGMIVQRGYKQPPSFHQDRLRNAPLGHFYDVISNGFGAMPDYAAQIQPEDRWAIAAYIRALQLSQHANESDVPKDDLSKLQGSSQHQVVIPPTSKNEQAAPQAPAGGEKP